MKIIVCIKQVPGSNEIKMDKETNTIIREGTESVLNPFDSYAIEEALRIKDKFGGSITAISMGIPKVEELLKEILELGIDEGVLLSDRAFAGSDSLATAYTLSRGIRKLGAFDLIICGKQATDGDTAQVGPSLGEKLNIPHITNVSDILGIKDGYLRCKREIENGYELLDIKLPAIITVVKDINVPRLPSIKTIKAALKETITIWKAEDIEVKVNHIGLEGSPTQVVKTFVPENNTEIEMLEGSPEQKAEILVDRLRTMGFLG